MLPDYSNLTPADLTAAVDAAISDADALVRQAVASTAAPSFAATMVPIELAGARIAEGYGVSAFLGYVHPDPAARDAGRAAEERITKWRVGLPFRPDLGAAVTAFSETAEAAALEGEDARLLEHWLRDVRRAGVLLDPPDREELEHLRQRLVELEVAFARNISESPDWIEVDRAGLDGLPDSFIERLAPGEHPGTWRVSLDYPELTPFLSQATNRDLREQLLRKNWNQAAAANRPLLAEALIVRHRIAELLGYPTWAHYAMEVKMAGTPERVADLYADLTSPLEAAARAELEELRRRHAAEGHSDDVQTWDWLYYDTGMSREDHGVDQDVVSEYLPLDPVIDGMFALTGEVFGLEYRRVPDAQAWHPTVQLFEIRDGASGRLLAHFYADLFPREGKFTHAAAFPLVMGHRQADGTYRTPVAAIVANFTPPSGDRPSLLRHGPHGEIETLFHEFGHILHMSLSRATYPRFSGSETEWDFVEAPSQIMEHWVWQPEVLRRFARHYRSGEPIPDDLVEHMVGARYLNVGLRGTRQIFFGAMDLALHTADPAPDLDDVLRTAYRVTQLPYPEDTFMLASFGHVMGGYDAGYYGYLWAEVIGDDMWGRFEREGITSPQVGADYRRAILEPNGTLDGDDLVAGFLGRPASVETYLRIRALQPAQD